MADTRAEKSGFAAEAQKIVHGKYDPQLARQVMEWIGQVSGQNVDISGDMKAFSGNLKDGVVLCRLANSLQPNAIKKINESSMAFKQMENIGHFLAWVEGSGGVSKHETFMTTDLFDETDPNSVLTCLFSLARKADKFGKPTLGPKEAQGEKRNWTDEQLRAGDGVIGLQMGSNKGASQAGMAFGKMRHIVD